MQLIIFKNLQDRNFQKNKQTNKQKTELNLKKANYFFNGRQ